MNATEQLNSYMKQLERRLRLGEILRGSAMLSAAALVMTLVLVLAASAFAFSDGSVTLARVALFATLSAVVVVALALPLRRLNRRRAAGTVESVFPQFQQRLITFAERKPVSPATLLQGWKPDPFLELLAENTLGLAASVKSSRVVPTGMLMTSLGVGLVSLSVLLWLIVAGPGYVGRGAALLWVGKPHAATPIYELRVNPGDASVRRNADQLVIAQLFGLESDNVRLYARYAGSPAWQQAPMRRQTASSGFEFLFAGLAEPVEYYVEAGRLRSPHFNIHVVDLASIKQLRVTYRFPAWTGLKNVAEDHGGDLRAVEGSTADIEVVTDGPLSGGTLNVDNNRGIALSGGPGNLYRGTIQIEKNGSYHITATDHGQQVRLSDDYFIEAQKPNPPDIRITSPGRDYKSSPIEEVTVAVKGSDDFGLRDMSLHYSVNGGQEQTLNVLKQGGAKSADGSGMIALENYKLVPGDLVSVYATAKDGHTESRTDMFFIQAEPFEKEYTQTQQSGSSDGGGNQQQEQSSITQRQKEIISATWNRSPATTDAQAGTDTGKFLSDMQSKLGEQARTLAARMQSRQLSQTNARFNSFVDDMNSAAQAMGPAADKLKQQHWNDAMPDEQKALQHLLRAEATFRDIQVAFGGSNGGAGGGDAERDLENLFNLELDTEKNQYETGQTAELGQQRNPKIDEALQKLRELAAREQELSEQQSENHQTLEQRWQQEMLRRQAEELRRQLEQMSQDSRQGGQQASSSQGGSSTNSQSGQQATTSGQAPIDPRIQQTIDHLRQADEDMRRASNQTSQGDARRAADLLREASGLLDGMQQGKTNDKLGSLASETERLLKQQQAQTERLRQMLSTPEPGDSPLQGSIQRKSEYAERQTIARQRQQMANDLTRLEGQLQQAINDTASSQQAASSKLRDALGDAQQSQLADKLRVSVAGIRRGFDRNFNSNEAVIGTSMQHLNDQVHQAQQALGQEQANPEEALNRIEHFRREMETLTRGADNRGPQDRRPGQQPQNSPGASPQGQAPNATQSGQQNLVPQNQGQPSQGQQSQGPQNQGPAQPMSNSNQSARSEGDYRSSNPGGPWDGYFGEDENAYLRPLAPLPEPSSIPPSQAYREALRDLDELRGEAKDDPEMLRNVQDLARQAARFNPNHFPGNPQLLEQLRQQVMTDVEKLELQVRRKIDEKQSGQVRTGASQIVPPGYRDSVADYFRRLSNKPQP